VKLYIILASLTVIFVVGGIGIFLSISNTVSSQNPIGSVGDEPSYSKILEKIKIISKNVTTPSHYFVGDEPNYSKILGIIKSIPEGNAFLLNHAEFLKIYSRFTPIITVDVDSISIHVGGGYTSETLTVYPLFDDSSIRIVYSCWTDHGTELTIESNILEVMEKSSCLGKLHKQTTVQAATDEDQKENFRDLLIREGNRDTGEKYTEEEIEDILRILFPKTYESEKIIFND